MRTSTAQKHFGSKVQPLPWDDSFAIEDFFPPVPAGVTPVAMPAEVQFAAFVAAFMATLEYGMEGA